MSFSSVIVYSDTFAELFCNKVLLMMLCFDSLMSVELFSDKFPCKIMCFYSSSSVTLEFKDGAVISV